MFNQISMTKFLKCLDIRILNFLGVCVLVFGVCFAPMAQAAVMSSTSYNMQIDSLNVGGGRGTSASYVLENTKGESGTGILSGTSYSLYAGFQLPVTADAAAEATPAADPGVGRAGTRRPQGAFPNIENFTAAGANGQIQLNWSNPMDTDFTGVRITRSEQFYPADPFDGQLIYMGGAEEFLDAGLQNGQGYYYTAFAYDQFGSFSSGAAAFGVPFDSAVYPERPEKAEGPEPPLLPPDLVPESLKYLTFLDFDFIQNGNKLPVIAGKVEANSDAPVTISIEYDKLPEVLKTIMVTMRDEEGKSFSFLLRINDEKTRYFATLRPPASGLYPLSFIVVDYKNQGLQKVEGELRVKEALAAAVAPPGSKWWNNYWPELPMFLLLAVLLLALAKYINKKLHDRSEKNVQFSKSNVQ
jgi:hypothetical protein